LKLPSIKKGFVLIIVSLFLVLSSYAASFEISGFIQSDNQQNIATKYNGFVEKIFVKEGDIVKKGEKLLQIDLKENSSAKIQTQIAMQQAELSYAMNKNDLEKAVLDFKRYQTLFEKKSVSKTNYEEIQLKKENLEKSLEIAKQQIAHYKEKLQEIEKQFQYLNINAQNKALIIAKYINEGELAIATKPLLAICDIENLVVYLEISESDLNAFRNNPDIEITIESLELTFKPTEITILPSANTGTNAFRVKLAFKSTDNQILPGMYVKVRVK